MRLNGYSAQLNEQVRQSPRSGLSALIVCATVDGRHILQGRVSLVIDPEQKSAAGYVVTFEDVTGELATLGKRDSLLRQAVEGLRRPVANLRAAIETLTGNADLDADGRAAFEQVLDAECSTLSEHLESLGREYHEIITGHWPMSDVYSPDLLGCVARRIREELQVEAVMTGLPAWVHCDSHAIVELLDHMVDRISQRTGATRFEVEAKREKRRVYLDVSWQGEVIPTGLLDDWLNETPDERLGGLTVRDVLEHHTAELWCLAGEDGSARIRLPLPPAVEMENAAEADARQLPSRPEFYDFDLLKRFDVSAMVADDRPLRELTYVAFDTETTGLEPSGGDEIISIAGIRIVNGRILSGEAFNHLVDPRRGIPQRTIKIHGITEEMVEGKPGIENVLPRFHYFVGDAVLIAHNAAFDMKFVELKQDACNVKFDNPIVDTVLLSAFLFDIASDHTLDALADRFGIRIEGRHTALGDSIVTAGVFLRMIELLEAQGISTLGEALEASNKIVEIRRQQAKY